jgi:hypothetical protein
MMKRAGEGDPKMPQEFPTIYRAKNLQEAQLLCNLLDDQGIRATVTNSILENGAGSEVMGWATSTRVMVAKEDAARAREFAMQFDRDASGRGSVGQVSNLSPDAGVDGPQVARDRLETYPTDAWPCCPECGNRRLTRCAFCGTSGNDFPLADANSGDILGLPTPPAEAFSGCSCGPGGCGTHGGEKEDRSCGAGEGDDDHAGATDAAGAVSQSASSALLLCPTCDEPFHPQYLRRCEWCGHEFPDGVEMPLPEEQAHELFNWRIAYVIYVLAILAIGSAVYLLLLF